MPSKLSRRALPALVLLALLLAIAVPPAASALQFKIVNESGLPDEDVYVTVVGAPGKFQVPGINEDEPVALSTISNPLTINELVSGRIYISYGEGVTGAVPFNSPTRFDWAELTVTPEDSDVANLTAVDQFGIGMRLDTFAAGNQHLEAVGAANSNTIFAAMQQIPGGPQATVRNGSGEILRILSPIHTAAYPDLGEYVRSMSGQTITLHTAFFGTPFTTSLYSGTFAADGSLELTGTTNPPGEAPVTISFEGPKLIEDIYTGAGTPNNMEGTIRRDVYAGFATGFWGGKYGSDALSFCDDPMTTGQGSWCPNGFNQPSFGDARAGLSPFPTCEQYAAVINEFSDVYGNPYSDAAKKVTVSLDQPVSGGEVETLQLTIQPDSGDAQPVVGGNSNCGAGEPATAKPISGKAPGARVKARFVKKAKVRGAVAKVGRISCGGPCGRVKLIARKGRRVVGRAMTKGSSATRVLTLRLTKPGKRLLATHGRLKVTLRVLVTPPGGATVVRTRKLTLIAR